jgi:hypothetical protein
MKNNKIFIFLPDGIGLRNFAYSDFYELGKKRGFNVVFWNNTPFGLTELGFKEIKIQYSKSHPITETYKNARKQIELNLNIRRAKDKVYDTYRFPFSYQTPLKAIKSVVTQLLSFSHSSKYGLNRIRKKIKEKERKTLYYHQCLETLQKENPAMVFCTNQRPMMAIAPLIAAQYLGIPTATFIFSWDNLPKSTMVVETDYYFVWSDLMKKELLFYYPYVQEEQIFISGTPQFEAHFNQNKSSSKEEFFKQNNLDINKKYICFSGDDITTSPDDPAYLEDAAKAVIELNNKGYNIGIIFRRCPVDFSNRYDTILKKYSGTIVSIDPIWKSLSSGWNTVLPAKEDDSLLSNLGEYCEMVINLGSSMVFDFICHKKVCAYFRYNQQTQADKKWDIFKCYQYVHFRSMPNDGAVVWLDSPNEIASKIAKALKESETTVSHAKDWFKVINQHPPQGASQRIWDGIKTIIQ